jgi:5'-nucleotidase
MSTNLQGKLIIAISSRALFNLDESHALYEKDGVDAYLNYQIENENNILEPGMAYHLVKKLLALQDPVTREPAAEVILLSRNSADTGLRVFNSIQQHELRITRAVFTNGEPPYQYIRAFGGHLFLSAHSQDVIDALNAGCAAATILKSDIAQQDDSQLRIAFDGDAVIFSDEAERIYQASGIAAFRANESAAAQIPLPGGPFKSFLAELHQLQKRFPTTTCPIRTALITARDAPAHERVIRTLRAWNIRIDEALFLGGLAKGDFLKAFGADIFFDDQRGHCETASQHVATGHVPHGIVNS